MAQSPTRTLQRGSVSGVAYDQVISDIVKVVEAVGAGIMVIGGLFAFVDCGLQALHAGSRRHSYRQLRRRLGQVILLGLEVLIVGDIVRTIIVDPTLRSVAVLGMIVIIRIILSFSLEVEIDGVWPWNRRRIGQPEISQEPPI
jgi:uncharacterized membrane protein